MRAMRESTGEAFLVVSISKEKYTPAGYITSSQNLCQIVCWWFKETGFMLTVEARRNLHAVFLYSVDFFSGLAVHLYQQRSKQSPAFV